MGCDLHEGIIDASTAADAVRWYREHAPWGSYDNQSYQILDVRVFPETLPTVEEALMFLHDRVDKWDMKAGIVRCANGRFVYCVLMPC